MAGRDKRLVEQKPKERVMTRRHELDIHRHKLHEIRNIMYSMKTLAVMETHKLDRYIKAQLATSTTIQNMAADFLHFHQNVLPEVEPTSNIVLLSGSERGFCGNYNERLIQKLEQFTTSTLISDTTLIVIGHKLHSILKDSDHNILFIEGADVAEDIVNVVENIAHSLAKFQKTASLYAIYHNTQHEELIIEKLLPSFQEIPDNTVNFTTPPILNLKTTDFFLDLTDHYLYSALHRVLYVSLMIENQHRVSHLENATHHLDNKTDELSRKSNVLRQEEIIEEIEVILLNESIS